MKDIHISFNRWTELLQRTAQGNNWKALHPRFNTDNSYYREMKNYIDYVSLSSSNIDEKKVKDSINRNIGIWKAFCESASINFVKQYLIDPKMRPTKCDMKQFQELFIRSAKQGSFKSFPNEADWDLIDLMADLHKISVDKDISLDKAFGLEASVGHPVNNPFEVPDYIKTMVWEMISHDIGQAEAIRREIDNPKTPSHSEEHYKMMMSRHKWTALNDFLYNRYLDGDKTLSKDEMRRISKNWDKIKMPEKLEIHKDFIQMGIGNQAGTSGSIKVKSEVVKTNKNLN
jgi:hypothetical protein